MTSSLTGRFWYDRPQDAGVDPDFDDLENLSGLTLAQIRDPGLTLVDMWNPKGPGDPFFYMQRQREVNNNRRLRLNNLTKRLAAWRIVGQRSNLRYQRKRVKELGRRLKAASNFKVMVERKREKLQDLSVRFLMAQTNTYPKFNFTGDLYNFGYSERFSFTRQWSMTYRKKCNKCIPYNGHHTINYWNTGQEDCW